MAEQFSHIGERTLHFQIPMLHGPDVVRLQEALIAKDLLSARHADGRYNLYTRKAVQDFEEVHNLVATGIVPDGDQSALFHYINKTLNPVEDKLGVDVVTDTPIKPEKPKAVINPEWLDDAAMKRVIVHWTAGNNKASDSDRKHYHFLIEGDGTILRGKHKPSDNESTKDGKYAAHTLSTNTGSIGLSLCGMHGANERPFRPGSQPINDLQWQVMAQAIAQICDHYDIEVGEKTVLGHGEVERLLGIKQKQKWDPMVLPWDTGLSKQDVGEKLRDDVRSAFILTADSDIRQMDAEVLGIALPKGAVTHDARSWISLPALQTALSWTVLDDEADDGTILRAGEIDIFATSFTHIDKSTASETIYVNADDLAEALQLKIAFDASGVTVLLTGEPGGKQETKSGKTYRTVTVKRGDFLVRIAERILGDKERWIEILDAEGNAFTPETARNIAPGEQVLVPIDAVGGTNGNGSNGSEPDKPDNGSIPGSANTDLANRISEVVRTGNKTRARKAVPVILAGCRAEGITDLAHIAYVFATAEHETNFGATMAETWTNSSRQRRYQGKYGNTASGDGKKYRGRGYVQLTFKANYKRFGTKLGLDLIRNPELAAVPEHAADILAIGMKSLGYRSSNLVLGEFGFGDDFRFEKARSIINADVNEHETRYGATRGKAIGAQARKYYQVLKGQ